MAEEDDMPAMGPRTPPTPGAAPVPDDPQPAAEPDPPRVVAGPDDPTVRMPDRPRLTTARTAGRDNPDADVDV